MKLLILSQHTFKAQAVPNQARERINNEKYLFVIVYEVFSSREIPWGIETISQIDTRVSLMEKQEYLSQKYHSRLFVQESVSLNTKEGLERRHYSLQVWKS